MSDFSDMVVIVFAWRRPYYLEAVLNSWSDVQEIKELGRFIIGLGEHPRKPENYKVIAQAELKFGREIEVLPDSPRAQASPAMHRPMGEAANHAWSDPKTGWVILSEEDNLVSDDVLRYMRFCRDTFESNEKVLLACAHAMPDAPGWTGPAPAERDSAVVSLEEDQSAVRLKQGFDSHAWGTWRDRWTGILEPTWDWECNSGGTTSGSGIDWNIACRVMPQGGLYAACPDASRSHNIGQHEGVYMIPGDYPRYKNPSYREFRGEVEYRFTG
jgi:hypothetical protein